MTVAMLIENLQLLQKNGKGDFPVMVYDESTGKLLHVVLAEIEEPLPFTEPCEIRLYTNETDI